jgi:hypothetical protein
MLFIVQLNARYELTVDCAGPTSLNTEQRPHSGGDGNSACGSPSEGAGGGPSSPDVFRSPVGGFTAATFMKAAEQGGIVVPPHRRHIVDEQSILGRTFHFVCLVYRTEDAVGIFAFTAW